MSNESPSFEELGLNSKLLKALKDVGYETPSPIQSQSIPPLLEGRDIIGQAQTGTGKTAAFALPILSNLNLTQKTPQVLVLAPTRELAIQVAEAFQAYAHHMKGFHILPIYGGQGYEGQLRALRRGVHVVVGTPGRVMDHIRKGTLVLDGLSHLVLDEADEMLRMGFIDDVEWIMERTPKERQIALFSATMPPEIAKVAKAYLTDPVLVKIETKTRTAETINQRYWPVSRVNKLDAVTRILEAETFDAMIIFVRTKTTTVELAERLEARGFRASALNGDITQKLRERTVDQLKKGQIDILVATDVAARGLDVDRISHVLNYDIPYDTESYVHRIGRTGRAGRTGEAILFVARREMRMLRTIEKSTGKDIEQMLLPSAADINEQRLLKFKQRLSETIESGGLDFFETMISEHIAKNDEDPVKVAAALAKLLQGDSPFLLTEQREPERFNRDTSDGGGKFDRNSKNGSRKERGPRGERGDRGDRGERPDRSDRSAKRDKDVDMETFRVEVGHNDEVRPGDLVGAIANEAGIESQYIGHIKIYDEYSTVDLPSGMPREVQKHLQKVWVRQKQLKLAAVKDGARGPKARVKPMEDRKPKKKKPEEPKIGRKPRKREAN